MDEYLRKPLLASFAQSRLSKFLDGINRRFSSSAFESSGLSAVGHNFAALAYSTINIGDEIQTIAQLGFLPPHLELATVNRDHLDRYRGIRRILIANGWFLHNRGNWPPASNLDLVFVSFHMADEWQPDDVALAYLRLHAPIGCRDLSTVQRLQGYGIEAYFTGCLTLTLEKDRKSVV